MKCQVRRPQNVVAPQGQLSAGPCRVMGGPRGVLRGEAMVGLLVTGGALVAAPQVPVSTRTPARTHQSRATGRRVAGARLRAGPTGRRDAEGWGPGISSRAGGAGLTGRNRRGACTACHGGAGPMSEICGLDTVSSAGAGVYVSTERNATIGRGRFCWRPLKCPSLSPGALCTQATLKQPCEVASAQHAHIEKKSRGASPRGVLESQNHRNRREGQRTEFQRSEHQSRQRPSRMRMTGKANHTHTTRDNQCCRPGNRGSCSEPRNAGRLVR